MIVLCTLIAQINTPIGKIYTFINLIWLIEAD